MADLTSLLSRFLNALYAGSVSTGTSLNLSGALTFSPDNTYDIGASGAQPRDVNIGRNLSVAGNAVMGASSDFYWSARAVIQSPSDGTLMLSNNAETDFSRLQFGGTTSSFGALARDAAGIKVIAADGTTGAFLSGVEQTAPSAPSANGYRLFAQDNGAGKTQLMVIFGSGAAQQIAIEP